MLGRPAITPSRRPVVLAAVCASALWSVSALATERTSATEESLRIGGQAGRQQPGAPAAPSRAPIGPSPASRVAEDVTVAEIEAAMRAAFAPGADTLAFVVVHRDRILAERYAPGLDATRPLPGGAMGEGVIGALTGAMIAEGGLELWEPPDVTEWNAPGDPRAEIRVADLLRKSSGLADAPESADETHRSEAVLARPLAHPPATVARDTADDARVLATILSRKARVRGATLGAWARGALYDRIGITTDMLPSGPDGGVDPLAAVGTAREWARLGMLFLRDGLWEGRRVLPGGFSEFASTPGPAWPEPVLGGAFRVNGDGRWSAPRTAYYLAGAGGQLTFVIPTHELVVVRLGGGDAEPEALRAFDEALVHVMRSVPQTRDDTAPGSHLWEPAPE